MPWKKVTFHNYFLAAFIMSVISILGIFLVKKFLPPVIPIFYGKPVGEDQLGTFWFFFIIPAVSILITTVNFLISMSAKDEFVKKVLAVSALVISLTGVITVIKIVLLVGFF